MNIPILLLALTLAPPTSHELVPVAGGWEAANPSRGMHSHFSPRGIDVSADGAMCGLRLESWGRAGAMRAAQQASLHVLPGGGGRRIELRRGPLTEWYSNDERGVEQGFVVHASPAGDGPLTLRLALSGGFTAEVRPGGRDAVLVGEHGALLHYTGLRAWDAGGYELEASLAATGHELSILVEDADAAYPLTIDPIIWREQAELLASNGAASDGLGTDVAVDGGVVVCGSVFAAAGATAFAGAAYVFEAVGTSWVERAELVASDAGAFDRFGAAVSLDGNTLVVGAPDYDQSSNNEGAAYVFVFNGTTWSEEARLIASDASGADRFGFDVAISGDTVVVGAPNDDSQTGSVYVFVRNGIVWSEQQKLRGATSIAFDQYGTSVAISGDTVLAGAPGQTSGRGAAYVHVRSGTTWTEQAELKSTTLVGIASFGSSVALEGDTGLVGAPGAFIGATGAVGAAYLFDRSGTTWTPQPVLIASDGAINDRFGTGVDLAGATAIIGASLDDDGGTDSGAAYVFERSGTSWAEETKLTASDSATNNWFGQAVSASPGVLVAGAPLHDELGHSSGAAYVFARLPAPTVTYCTAGTSAAGCTALLSSFGLASATAPVGFIVLATNVEGSKNGIFFLGANGRQANPWGSGTSYQCVVPPVTRLGLLSAVGTPGSCDGGFSKDLNAHWCPTCPKSFQNPGYGVNVQVQLWYRDPLNTSNQTTSLSNALEFCIGP